MRFDDMFLYIKDMVGRKTKDFTLEERNLMSVAFKNMINADRKAIKLVTDISNFEKFQKFEGNLRQYKKKVDKVLAQKCQSICDLLE